MMKFFRKHQKKLFIVIAIVIIASFLFFGTFSTFGAPEIPNKKIGKTVGGVTLYERDLKALMHFLSLGSGKMLRDDLFETGVIARLGRVEHLTEGVSFEECFGPSFTTVVGKFILNAAECAEKRGYRVSQQEARSDLLLHCRKALKAGASPQEVAAFFRFHLQVAGVDESTLVRLWQKALCMHRQFQDLEQGVLLDPLPYETFSSFADATASATVYQLPEALRLSDFQALVRVQYYLEAISPAARHTLALPRTFYTLEQIEKKHPQLVIHRYGLEVSKASYEELALQVGLKELWDFETGNEGWSLLTAAFPQLKALGDDRLQAIEQVEPKVRKQIDRFAVSAFLHKHPERVNEVLNRSDPIFHRVALRSQGEAPPFDDVQETAPLLHLLEEAAVGSVVQFTSEALTYYRIKMVEKPHVKEVMTLDEALTSGALHKLVDTRLETALLEARKKDPLPYRDSDGTWKPFREVKDLVGAYIYSDLLKSIAKETLPFEEYAFRRFEAVMHEAKASIETLHDDSPFLRDAEHPLLNQWKIVACQREIKRSDPTTLSKEALFTNPVGSWSHLVGAQGDIAFFQLMGRDEAESSIEAQVYAGQKLIGKEMTQQMVAKLLEEMGPL